MCSTLQLLAYFRAGLQASEHRFRETLPPAIQLVDLYARNDWHWHCEDACAFVQVPSHRHALGTMLMNINDSLAASLWRRNRTRMRASVEFRVPFLDLHLVHKAINLPRLNKAGTHLRKRTVKQVARRYTTHGLVFRKQGRIARSMATWKAQVQWFFGPIAFELWRRIFMIGQSTDEVSALVQRCERLAT